MRTTSKFLATLFLFSSFSAATAWAQDPSNWHRFDNPDPNPQVAQSDVPPQTDPAYSRPSPADTQQQLPPAAPQRGAYPRFPARAQEDERAPYAPIPDAVNVPAGKYINVRINQFLSTDHSRAGDYFSASLVEPLVVDGVVLARRGQTVNGRVVESDKGGRVKGTSSMRIELTELLLVDGQQIPVKTSMVSRRAGTSVGRDVAGVATTTGVGALIGAGVNGGVGAGVGAAAGLVVATIGVLVTRGHPTVIDPETVITFRVEAPLTVSTVRSRGAFAMVTQGDYEQQRLNRPPMQRAQVYQRPYFEPYFYGPSVFFYSGPRFGYYGGRHRW